MNRQPRYSPDGEWIVYSALRGGNVDVWSLQPRTGAVRRLTDSPAVDYDPALTPDGKHLVFSSDRSGNYEIWMADADGSGARQVTHDGVDAENATATPDGEWIVYASGDRKKFGIWKVRPDGSEPTIALLRPRRMARGLARRPVRALHVRAPDGGQRGQGRPHFGWNAPAVLDPAGSHDPAGGADRGPCPVDARRQGDRVRLRRRRRGASGSSPRISCPGGTRRRRAGRSPGSSRTGWPETFAISPDGKRICLAEWEQVSSLMTAQGVAGVDRARCTR